MKVTKLGHCCMLLEIDGLRILTDPGGWSGFKQDELREIDLVLLTHEHGDHFHLDSLKRILNNNPQLQVITNTSVGKLLQDQAIEFAKLEQGETNAFAGVQIEGFGDKHEEIYGDYGQVQNTGYFVANKFFYPGDAFINPHKPVELLALPVAGPWLKSKEVIAYAQELRPTHAFPVHDGMLAFPGPYHFLAENFLSTEMQWHSQEDLQTNLVIEI